MGILALLSRVPFAGKFLGSKWFWIIFLVIFVLWFGKSTIQDYAEDVREQVVTQLRASEYRNRVEELELEKETLEILRDEQNARYELLQNQRQTDRRNYENRLRALQNSGLTGGETSDYLAEALRGVVLEDGVAYEDVMGENQNDEP